MEQTKQTAVQTEVEQTAEQSNGTRKPSTHGSYTINGMVATYDRGAMGSMVIDFTGASMDHILEGAARSVVWRSTVEDGSVQEVNYSAWMASGGKRGGSLPGGLTVAEARREILASPHADLFRSIEGIKDLFNRIKAKYGRHPVLSDFTAESVQKWTDAVNRLKSLRVEV